LYPADVIGDAQDGIGVLVGEAVDRLDLALDQAVLVARVVSRFAHRPIVTAANQAWRQRGWIDTMSFPA